MSIIESENLINAINSENWEEYINDDKNIKNNTVSGNNLLHLACARGKEDIINKIILKYPQLIYLSNSQGENCSYILLKHGWFDIFKNLISKYSDIILLINNDGNSIFQIIIDQPFLLKYLITSVNENNKFILDNINNSGKTLLIQLIEIYKLKKNNLELLKLLFKEKINLNHPINNLPLNYAIQLNLKEIVILLLNNGADPNLKDNDGKSSIMISIKKNLYNLTKILINNGADINIHDHQLNNFPLNIALNHKNKKIVKLIMDNKPNYKFKDKYLNTPLHYCLYSNNEIQWLNSSMIFEIIFNSDLNIKNIKGITGLHILNNSGLWKYYTELLKIKELNVHAKDYKNRTPMSLINKRDLITFLDIINTNNSFEKKINNNKEIIMPQIILTNYGKFNSDLLHNILYTIIFLDKYDELMIPFVNNNNKILPNLYKTEIGNLLYSIVNLFKENFNEISPYVVIWHNKNINYFDENLKYCINDLLNNDNIRFFMIKLTIIAKTSSTHANILLYDKKKNELYRFEPYGELNILDYDILNDKIEKKFKKYINTNLKYFSPKDYLKETHFQLVSNENDHDNKKLGDPQGYCLAFCFWFIEIKLRNPEEDIEILMKKSLDQMVQNINYSNPILDHIRNYANKLDMMSTKFLQKAGIQEEYIYNMSFEEEQINIIVNYCKQEFDKLLQKKKFKY